MAIKISYEWCLGEGWESEPNQFECLDPHHADIKNLDWLLDGLMDHTLFNFCVQKWFYNTVWDEGDFEQIYLRKDGTFEKKLPKYLMKIIEPRINDIINHKNFRGRN